DDNLKEKEIQKMFLLTIPVSSIFLLMKYFETLFQADNQIKLLSQSRLIPKVVFAFATLGLCFFFQSTSMDKLGLVWIIFFCTQILVYIFIIYQTKISINNF